ncbi:hypothetical protein [Kitasatospora sp. NBC_01539]|uniref:hypothetical protein n=1 Tax=Kitasatospora sp. NBC_01539 TaxID=2903577 RepID=UPI003860226E
MRIRGEGVTTGYEADVADLAVAAGAGQDLDDRLGLRDPVNPGSGPAVADSRRPMTASATWRAWVEVRRGLVISWWPSGRRTRQASG